MGQYTVSRARQIILDQGVQLGAYGVYDPTYNPLNYALFLTANYTILTNQVTCPEAAPLNGANFGWTDLGQQPVH